MQYTTIFTKEEDWWYTVEVLELPWCLSYWETLEEAQEMIKDALIWYIVSLKKHWEFTKNISNNKFISSIYINDTI